MEKKKNRAGHSPRGARKKHHVQEFNCRFDGLSRTALLGNPLANIRRTVLYGSSCLLALREEPNRFPPNKGYLPEVKGDSPLFRLDQSF